MDAAQTFRCDRCNKAFTREDNLKRHLQVAHPTTPEQATQDPHALPQNRLPCPHQPCSKTFSRSDNLKVHVRKHHSGVPVAPADTTHQCRYCGKEFDREFCKKRQEQIHIRKLALPGAPPSQPIPAPSTSDSQGAAANTTAEISEAVNSPWITVSPEPAVATTANPPSPVMNVSIPNSTSTSEAVQRNPDSHRSVTPNLNPAPGRSRKRRNPATHDLDQKTHKPILRRAKRALRGALVSYKAEGEGLDPAAYLDGMLEPVQEKLISSLKKDTGKKLCMSLQIRFYKPKEPEVTSEPFFWSKQLAVLRGDDIREKVKDGFPKILNSIDTYVKEGSGWAIEKILGLEIHLSQYRPLNGNSYAPLPPKLRAKKAILNIVNQDQKCFLWSILAHLHPVSRTDNANQVSHYTGHEHELDCDGFEFPMKTTQVSKFERKNGLSINVYGYDEDDGLHPLHLSEEHGPHIGLVLYDGHYSLIRNLNRLLGDQRGHRSCKWFCHRCLFPFYSRGRMEEHQEYCGSHAKQTMSDKPSIQFENLHKMQKQPLVVYADFECLLEPIESCAPNPAKSSTERYQRHTPCGFGLVEARSCCGSPEFSQPQIYRGKDCVDRFLRELQSVAVDYHERLDNAPGLRMTDADEEAHLNTTCHICEKQIADPEEKVRDHCHICGQYRGPAHNHCNQQYRLNRDIVVVFHNLRRYDGHIIMQQIAQSCSVFGWEPSCIAKSMEDYLGFRLHTPASREDGTPAWNIRFVDSAQFLSCSLDGLVKALPRDDFEALKSNFGNIDLLVRKGVYPYEYMSKWERFEETRLPPKEAFYDKLSKSHISDEDYEHARRVWGTFGVRNMGMFHDHYLKSDTLQLADVVETFRGVCMRNYGLDPMHYITLPSFAWDACLKLTKVQLETIQDPDQYTFLENGIRGGISVIMHRYFKANNPLCPDFDPSQPTNYIMYYDANNLYGWAMVQDLPTHGLHWVQDVDSIDWTTTKDGYIVEVDLDYPSELHDKHNDYPLAPERMVPTDLSAYQLSLQEDLDVGTTGPKLIPNLNPKQKYTCHIRNLQQYLQYGMVLKKVHRALAFQQSPWMKPYIELNTRLRTAATSEFEKSLFKLMNNAVFGKTMENVRKYRDVKLVLRAAQFRKLAANPRYRRSCIFSEEFVGMMMERKSVCLDKPIYVGFTVLDLSKTLMYDFHYGYMVPKYGDQAKLMFTDTDSFIYALETPDVYADMYEDHQLYDTSDYPVDHPLHSTTNKKVLGKMKDEMNGVPIWKFVGLRPKMYSFLDAIGVEKKRAKGIKRSTVKNEIRFADYMQALNERTAMHHTMNQIRSDAHQLFSATLTKKSLCPYDDKRYILPDGITTLAHGHTDIDLLSIPLEAMETD